MGELRNRRREAFARGLAEGQTVQQAFTSAGYSFHRQTAHRLSSASVIKNRVVELKEQRQTNLKNGRDEKSGQFLQGASGNPNGRPKGSRNKLGEQFITDLQAEWEVSGPNALKRVVEMDPTAYVKIVAGLMPAKIDLAVDIELSTEVREFAEAWRLARSVIGADEPQMIELQPIQDEIDREGIEVKVSPEG
jgi:Family of unknown function (DUF5681)